MSDDHRFAASTFSDFFQIEELHRSQTGAVYSAHFKYDKKKYVLKERKLPELGRRKDIMNEVTLLRQLSHPNVVRCEGFFRDQSRRSLFIVLEYCGGGDLYCLIKSYEKANRCISEALIWHIFFQLCDGLKHLHENGIVHRDIKTMNVMCINEGEVVKLADLGVSRQLSEETLMLNTFYGTPLYLSPELVENKPYNEKTDIWSLGIILYEMASLVTPFRGATLMELGRNVMSGKYNPIPPGYSADLSKCIKWMLNCEMTHRPNIVQLLKFVEQRRDAQRIKLGGNNRIGGLHEAENRGASEELLLRTDCMEAAIFNYKKSKENKNAEDTDDEKDSLDGQLNTDTIRRKANLAGASTVHVNHHLNQSINSQSYDKPEQTNLTTSQDELESRFGDKLNPKKYTPLGKKKGEDGLRVSTIGPSGSAIVDNTMAPIAGIGGWNKDGSSMPDKSTSKDGTQFNIEGLPLTSRRHLSGPVSFVEQVLKLDNPKASKEAVKNSDAPGSAIVNRNEPNSLATHDTEAVSKIVILDKSATKIEKLAQVEGPEKKCISKPYSEKVNHKKIVSIDRQVIQSALRHENVALRKLFQARDFSVGLPGMSEEIRPAQSDGLEKQLRSNQRQSGDSTIEKKVRLSHKLIAFLENALETDAIDSNADEYDLLTVRHNGFNFLQSPTDAIVPDAADNARNRIDSPESGEVEDRQSRHIESKKEQSLPISVNDNRFVPVELRLDLKRHKASKLQKQSDALQVNADPPVEVSRDLLLDKRRTTRADNIQKPSHCTQNSSLAPALTLSPLKIAIRPSTAPPPKMSGRHQQPVSENLDHPNLSDVVSHSKGPVIQVFKEHDYRNHRAAHFRVKTPKQDHITSPRQELDAGKAHVRFLSRPHSAIINAKDYSSPVSPKEKGGYNEKLYPNNGLQLGGLHRINREAYASKEQLLPPNTHGFFADLAGNSNRPRRFHRKAPISSGDAHRGESSTSSEKRKNSEEHNVFII